MQSVRIGQLVLLGAALRRLDRYRRQSHEDITSSRFSEIPANIPPECGDAEIPRRIATDIIESKMQGK